MSKMQLQGIIIVAMMAIASVASAQISEYPPNAEPGKCYLQMYTPSEFDYQEVTEIDRSAYKKNISIPAIYEYVYDTTVLRPAQKKLEVVPESYTTVAETVMIAPPTTKWVTDKIDPNCLSEDPADCRVVCLVEVPAKYTTYERRVLETQSYTREINVPAEIKISTKKVLKSAARTEEYEVPATFKTVMKRVVKKKGYVEWKEVLCSEQINASLIKKVQKALNDSGYEAGAVDGVWGTQTANAIVKYAQDKGLPVSKHINLDVCKALGVDYKNN